jgi:hypothetical protein
MENKCDSCIHNEVCDHNRFGWENCGHYKPSRTGYAQQYNKNKYETRKANHQCVVCGCELPENAETIKCDACKEAEKRSKQKYYKKRVDNGLCIRCGEPLPKGAKHKACFNCRQEECRKRCAKNETM